MNKKLKTNLIAIGLVTGLSIFSVQNTLSRPMFGMKTGANSTSHVLERMDYNDDGIISEEDLLNRMLESAEKRFNRKDSNDDGLLSLEEFSAKTGRFADIDHDALKQCISESVDDSYPVRLSPEEAFSDADSDDNASIDSNEYEIFISNRATERFNRMDSDADGILSDSEITDALETRSEMRQVRRNCVSEQTLLLD